MNQRQIKRLIRAKRFELLKKQDELDKQHCQQCTWNRRTNNDCIGCEVYEQLQAIGNDLLNLSNGNYEIVRKENELMTKVKAAEEPKVLTVEVYKELKEQGMSDTKIMKQFNINNAKFYDWKRNNGLIEKKVTLSKQETTSSNENSKPKDGEHLMREKEQMQNEMKNLSQELIKLRDEKDALMKSNATLRGEKAILRNRLTEVEEEYKKLHDLKHELTQNIEKANEIIEELREENEKLKSISERGEYYMKLSFMLMEGVVRELKEDAN